MNYSSSVRKKKRNKMTSSSNGINSQMLIDPVLLNTIQSYYPYGTKVIDVSGSYDNFVATFRLKCKTKEDFKEWLNEHQRMSGITWRVAATKPSKGVSVVFKCFYRCQHNTYPKSHNVKSTKKNTDCEANMKVTIKSPIEGRRCRSKDTLREHYPTIVRVRNRHNHSIMAALKFRDPSEEIKEKFLEMLMSNHSPPRALELHKQDLMRQHEERYFLESVDRSICPDLTWVYRLYYKNCKPDCGEQRDNATIVLALQDMVKNIPPDKGQAKLQIVEDQFVVAACPKFMERVHQLEVSGQIVLVDSSGNAGRFNCHVFLLTCDSAVGRLPLGFLLSSSECQDIVLQGFQLLKEIMPTSAFGGKGELGPEFFLVDDTMKDPNVLLECFPEAQLWLCSYHVLQAVWRWLWDERNKVDLEDRKYLYEMFKSIVTQPDAELLNSQLNYLFVDDNAKKYPQFLVYLDGFLKKAPLWGHAFQRYSQDSDDNTRNIMRTAMWVSKDKILNHTSAFNAQRVFSFLFESACDYYSSKILDAISHQKQAIDDCLDPLSIENGMQNLKMFGTDISVHSEKVSEGIYLVQTPQNKKRYPVNVHLCCCTCRLGKHGGPCEHQHVLRVKLPSNMQNPEPISEEAIPQYRWIATGSAEDDDEEEIQLSLPSPASQELNNSDDTSSNDSEDDMRSDALNDELPQVASTWNATESKLRKVLDHLYERVKEGFPSHPEEYAKAVDAFHETVTTSLKTDNELLPSLHNFGKVICIAVTTPGSNSSASALPALVCPTKMVADEKTNLEGTKRPRVWVQEHGYAKAKRVKLRAIAPRTLQEQINIVQL